MFFQTVIVDKTYRSSAGLRKVGRRAVDRVTHTHAAIRCFPTGSLLDLYCVIFHISSVRIATVHLYDPEGRASPTLLSEGTGGLWPKRTPKLEPLREGLL